MRNITKLSRKPFVQKYRGVVITAAALASLGVSSISGLVGKAEAFDVGRVLDMRTAGATIGAAVGANSSVKNRAQNAAIGALAGQVIGGVVSEVVTPAQPQYRPVPGPGSYPMQAAAGNCQEKTRSRERTRQEIVKDKNGNVVSDKSGIETDKETSSCNGPLGSSFDPRF